MDANLMGADLRGAYFRDADFRDADFRDADFRDANLSGADLRGADLRGAYFRDAYLSGADLSGANLRGAYFMDANLMGADLRGAILDTILMQFSYCNYHYAVAYQGYVKIGCENMKAEEWLEKYHVIAKEHGYSEDAVEAYLGFIRSYMKVREKEIKDEV
jgi:hypothetical protein